MSTLRANSIVNAAGNNTAQINGMTPTSESLQGFRNRIINGDMRIDQRNNGASFNNLVGGVYGLDRWSTYGTQSAKFSTQRSTVAPAGFTNSSLITSLSSYSILSSDFFLYYQNIEGFNIADFGWGSASGVSVTLSFWVRCSLTGTFGGHVNNNNSDMTYVFSYTINAANTWEQKTITIPAPSTSTWLTNNGVGLYLTFSIGAGSSTTRSVGWGSFARSVTGQTSLVGTNGATFYITGVQLEAGSVATPFERRDYGRELMMCQRYFEKSYLDATAVPTNTNTGSFGIRQAGANSVGTIVFAVNKRADPTMAYYSTQNSAAGFAYDSNGLTNVSMNTLRGGQRTNSWVISGTAGNYNEFQWTASAEL